MGQRNSQDGLLSERNLGELQQSLIATEEDADSLQSKNLEGPVPKKRRRVIRRFARTIVASPKSQERRQTRSGIVARRIVDAPKIVFSQPEDEIPEEADSDSTEPGQPTTEEYQPAPNDHVFEVGQYVKTGEVRIRKKIVVIRKLTGGIDYSKNVPEVTVSEKVQGLVDQIAGGRRARIVRRRVYKRKPRGDNSENMTQVEGDVMNTMRWN